MGGQCILSRGVSWMDPPRKVVEIKLESGMPFARPQLASCPHITTLPVLFEMLICCYENYLVTDKRNLEESALLSKWFLWYLRGFVSLQVMNIYVSEKIPHLNYIFGNFPRKMMTFPALA